MTLHVAILGIDGSGKSTVARLLPRLLAGELGLAAGSAGDGFSVIGPERDQMLPGFAPAGLGASIRTSLALRRVAKRTVDRPALYPKLKLAQMLAQDRAAHHLAKKHRLDVMVSDGNALLSATGRAANYLAPSSRELPAAEDLASMFDHLLERLPLSEQAKARLPNLASARAIRNVDRALDLDLIAVPDVVLFLDVSPEIALRRIRARGDRLDRHENQEDLEQARLMYRQALEALSLARPSCAVHSIAIGGDESTAETVAACVTALLDTGKLQPHLSSANDGLLGRSERITFLSVLRRILNPVGEGWRELSFPLTRAGRMLLKEGYSARVMRAIYQMKPRGLERVFAEYPLHRAVRDRLAIVSRRVEQALLLRAAEGRELSVLTAPSGFAFDLLDPLERIAARDPELLKRVKITAVDLDREVLAEVAARARKIGVAIETIAGDLTSGEIRARIAERGTYALALFIGLSSWISKPNLLAHLRVMADSLGDGGTLLADCFQPAGYAVAGHYGGFRASYYLPEDFVAILDYCGLAGPIDIATGRDGINSVIELLRSGSPGARRGRMDRRTRSGGSGARTGLLGEGR